MRKKFVFMLVAAVMTLAVGSKTEAKEGFYMGLGASYNSIGGNFDGTSVLQSESEVIILPNISNAFGIDLLAGYGINNQWAIELNLMSSGHSGVWDGITGDVSYLSFSVNGKYCFSPSGMSQPYFLFGISGNTLLIKDGAADTWTKEVGDATLFGTGINLGAGIEQYLNPNVSLNLGIIYRYVDYTEASGVNESATIDDGLDGSGFSFLVTTAYHF